MWYTRTEEELVSALKTDLSFGLASYEVIKRQGEFGANVTQKFRDHSWLKRLFLQFHQPLIYVLLTSAFLSAFLSKPIDAITIFAVVFLAAIIGFIQETKASSALKALSKTIVTKANVLRDGKNHEVSAVDLVPGDVVFLNMGDKVPADIRLTSVDNMSVDESSLTGESEGVFKNTKIYSAETIIQDQLNMAFASTLVLKGNAKGLVVGTGNSTEIGKIAHYLLTTEKLETPLTRKIKIFSYQLTLIILAFTFLNIVIGYLNGFELYDIIMSSIALCVAAIPEGLPAAFSMILAVGVTRMAKRNVIVRRFPAVEALGSVTVICTDKTGTITENKMTVTSIYVYDKFFSHWDEGPVSLMKCLLIGAVCNDATLTTGDPTEIALLVAAKNIDISNHRTRIKTIPFSSKTKYMETHYKTGERFLKGAVEVILTKVDKMLDQDGNEVALDKIKIMSAMKQLASEGLRVLAFAYNDVFVGLQGMKDPPRKDAIEAIAKCKEAGIKVKMITGDHSETARALAKEAGLQPEDIFARVTPEQKISIVQAFQKKGEITAMTGDGINDAPALRAADIGIAMGKNGTEVAKEAADIVLLDDHFATIEHAVEEGRAVFDNLTTFIAWTLPTNVGEAAVIMLSMLLGYKPLISPLNILWINLTTAICLGFTLVFDPKAKDIMERPPRDQKILTFSLFMKIVVFSLLIILLAVFLTLKTTDQTAAVLGIVLIQILYLIECSADPKNNKIMWVGIFAMCVMQAFYAYNSWMHRAFQSSSLNLSTLITMILTVMALYIPYRILWSLFKAINRRWR